jgi:hypothetical protein
LGDFFTMSSGHPDGQSPIEHRVEPDRDNENIGGSKAQLFHFFGKA